MDAVLNTKKLDFIRAQLAAYSGDKKEYGDFVMIRCPFHNDNTPSGRLSLNPTYAGYFKCYSCNARANWDEVAERLSLQPFKKGKPKEEYALNLLLEAADKLAEASKGNKLYRDARFKFYDLPVNKKWRGISTNLLIDLGGKFCIKWSDEYQRWSTQKFIYLPVNINEEMVGFFRARLKKEEDQPSYLNAGGKWSLNHGLFPFDKALGISNELQIPAVVLVEGQRDALRLISNGLPAMCIFGTQSISRQKLELLELAGIKHLISMMDGDDAGIEAAKKIKKLATGMFDKISTIKLWSIKDSPYLPFKDEDYPSKAAKNAGVELWDPGNCPQWVIDKVKSKFF